MREHYTYFIEKTSQLVRNLISGKGTAKERLMENEIDIVFCLALQIPVDLIPRKEKLMKSLTKKKEVKVGETVYSSSFQQTVSAMQNKTAAKITLELYDIFTEIMFRSKQN